MARRAESSLRALLLALLLCAADARAEEVDRTERLPVAGAQLYLLTRGADSSAPVLLWLHGGPGGAETPLFRLYDAELERHFVVAYWDQRGAGRSFDPEANLAELTVARHLADLDAVVDHLRVRFGREKLVLIGHSWGGTLGLLYVQAHPEKVAAFIGVAPVISELERQRAQRDFVASEARARGDEDAQRELTRIGEPPYSARQELAIQQLVDAYGGYFHRRPSFTWAALRGMAYGYAAPWEIPSFIRANNLSLEAMSRELLALDLGRSVPRLNAPVFFFLGRWDRQVDARLAAAYLERLEAPSVKTVWFEESAHNPPFEEPEKFCSAVREVVAALRD